MASVKPKSKSSRSPPSHPPFHDMMADAIAAMKEWNGSSQVAIRKFVEEKYGKRLTPNFRKNLILHLKRLVSSGKLVKLKKSLKKSTEDDAMRLTKTPGLMGLIQRDFNKAMREENPQELPYA